jgi:SSS family solute:Na+ symporter
VFGLYILAILFVGFYYFNKTKTADDYFVGGRNLNYFHIGLSVVATDVGGGFSIGLGGLGFTMGLSGSWLLFTGLIGAWMAAVLLIPRVYNLGLKGNFLTFPDIFKSFYGVKVAMIAGLISAIGYLGFTSSQVLAAAKLATATFDQLDISTALWVMGGFTVVYTAIGGIKAVIFTDTFQWIILLSGLLFVGIPVCYVQLGGWEVISSQLAPEFLSLTNIDWITIINWSITIIPIWFVGMTLYQRIYASKSEKEAKKAWFLAGLFEWPVMAFMGIILGMFSRVALEQGLLGAQYTLEGFDPELGLPLMIKTFMPVGLLGVILAAYFSAILSTADSCLMAASGNTISDLFRIKSTGSKFIRISQLATLVIGVFAIIIATYLQNVLELMLYSYAFMVSGLLVPLVAAVFFKQTNAWAAIASMIFGGFTTLFLIVGDYSLPLKLDPNAFGISMSLGSFILVSKLMKYGNKYL